MFRRLPRRPVWAARPAATARVAGIARAASAPPPADTSPAGNTARSATPADGPVIEPLTAAEVGPISTLEPPAVYRALRTSPGGLSSAEDAARLADHGPNELPRPVRRPLVLLDDNFATIVAAIEHGLGIYQNIRKFATYILTSNVPEIAPFVAMVGLKVPPALNVMQILSVDLGTDMVPALALGAEPPEAGLMARPPRPRGSALIDLPMLLRSYAFLGMIEALVSLVAFFAVWWRHGYGLADLQALTPALLAHTAGPVTTGVLAEATTASLAGIVACRVGNVFACRSESASAIELGCSSNRLIWLGIATEVAFLLAIAYWSPAQAVIHSAPLDPVFLVVLFAVAPLAVLIPEEIRKRLKPRVQGRSVATARS